MTDQPRVCENCGSSLADGDKFCPMCKTPVKSTSGTIATLGRIKKTRPAILIISGVLLGMIIVASAFYLPEHMKDWNQLGNDALNRNDFQGSVEYFNKALDLNPSSEEALIGLGDAYYNLIRAEGNNYALPLTYYEKASTSNEEGSSVYALRKMGLIYLSMGEYKSAQTQFQKIIDRSRDQNKIDPMDLAGAWYYKGSALMHQNNSSGAIVCFNNSMSISSGQVAGRGLNQMAMASMGEAFMKENRTHDAEPYYRSALDVSTDCVNCDIACHDLIKMYEKSNRFEDAKDYEERCYGKSTA